jgi:hypothetical protein
MSIPLRFWFVVLAAVAAWLAFTTAIAEAVTTAPVG